MEFGLSLLDEDPLISLKALQEVPHKLHLNVESIGHLLLCSNFLGCNLNNPYPVCCTQLVESHSFVVRMRRVSLHEEVVGLILLLLDTKNKRWFDHGM